MLSNFIFFVVCMYGVISVHMIQLMCIASQMFCFPKSLSLFMALMYPQDPSNSFLIGDWLRIGPFVVTGDFVIFVVR